MNADEKIIKALDDLRADMQKQVERLEVLQDDVTTIKAETAKIPGLEQRLDHHGKLLTGLPANMATVLEEQQAERSDIHALHTEVHASKEEVKEEILAARAEARADSMDVKATAMRQLKAHEKRIEALEEAAEIPHPDKN
jgi:chromosome segregation ATPase